MHFLLLSLAVVTMSSSVRSDSNPPTKPDTANTFTCKKNVYGIMPTIPLNMTADYNPLGEKRSVGYCGYGLRPTGYYNRWALKRATNNNGVFECHSSTTTKYDHLCCQATQDVSESPGVDAEDCRVIIPGQAQFPDAFYSCHPGDLGKIPGTKTPRHAGVKKTAGYCGLPFFHFGPKNWTLEHASMINSTKDNGAPGPQMHDCNNTMYKVGMCCPPSQPTAWNFTLDASACVVMRA